MISNKELTLYLATEPSLLASEKMPQIVAEAVRNGVTMVQLRGKDVGGRVLYEQACALREATDQFGVPLIINDRVDIMLAVDAAGVHLGREDLPVAEARKIAPKKIIGYSVNKLQHLDTAHKEGADYAGVGPVFHTATKGDTGDELGIEGVRDIAKHAQIPLVGIGGINQENIKQVIRAGVDGCCVISAILSNPSAPSPGDAAKQLRAAIDSQKQVW